MRLARRLDAAKRAAKFFDLAFVGEFLAFGDFHEFEHFIEMIRHLFEGIGNFRGVFHGLADGRGVGGPEIRITRTRCALFLRGLTFLALLALRLTFAFLTFGALGTVRRESLWRGPGGFNAFGLGLSFRCS